MALGLFGILVSLAVLILLAYRGVSVIVTAPLVAGLAVLFNAPAELLAAYTQVFMVAMGDFAARYFPIFLLGAIFGKLMQDSGSAHVIAQKIVEKVGKEHAALATVLSCGLLGYGGVSVFVVAFAVHPLASALFREANVPRRLIPGAIGLGAFTFSLTCLPGTVQIHNMIPMPFFKTTSFAAPGLGTLGGVLMLLGGMFWLSHRIYTAERAHEGYGAERPGEAASHVPASLPPFWAAVAPIVAVIVLNYVFSKHLIPHWDVGYLAAAKYGGTNLGRVVGTWSTILALTSAVLLSAAIHFRCFARLNQSLTVGAVASLLPTFNTASVVGYGATIAALSSFAVVKDHVLVLSPTNPALSEFVAISIMGAITGSASGGMSIVLETLGDTYYQLAVAHGVSLELMHRIAAMASSGMSTLPHNGAVITLLTICGLTHRQSYKDIAVVGLVIPVLVTVLILLIGLGLGTF